MAESRVAAAVLVCAPADAAVVQLLLAVGVLTVVASVVVAPALLGRYPERGGPPARCEEGGVALPYLVQTVAAGEALAWWKARVGGGDASLCLQVVRCAESWLGLAVHAAGVWVGATG